MLANNNTNNHTETSSSTATAGATTATAIAAKFGRISVVVTHHSKSILYSFDKLKTLPDSIQDICLNHFKLKNYKEYCLRTDCRTVPLEDDLLLNDDVTLYHCSGVDESLIFNVIS